MNLPMFGDATVLIQAVAPYTIHGDLYYRLQIVDAQNADAPPSIVAVPQHAAPSPPAAGQTWVVSFLMGQVTGAKPLP